MPRRIPGALLRPLRRRLLLLVAVALCLAAASVVQANRHGHIGRNHSASNARASKANRSASVRNAWDTHRNSDSNSDDDDDRTDSARLFLASAGGDARHGFIGGRHSDNLPSLGAYSRHFALLLQTSGDETEQLQGCIAICIAPRFFLTRASCVRDESNPPSLFFETTNSNSDSDDGAAHRRVPIITTTPHADFGVNLAILEIEDPTKSGGSALPVTPVPLVDLQPQFYRSMKALSFASVDNVFNPILKANPPSIESLVRVPASSCNFNIDPAAVNCYAPAELAARSRSFEFGQGVLLWKKAGLVGLSDCDGFCGGGMFYSATHLANFKTWINDATAATVQWTAATGPAQRAVHVQPDQEPRYVSLFASSGAKNAKPVCGGSLIAPRFVLTSASCIAKHTIGMARVGHGERSLGFGLRWQEEDAIPVASIHIHPQFANTTKHSNDLAILALEGPTFYTPTLLAVDDSGSTGVGPECGQRVSSIDASLLCLSKGTADSVRKDDRLLLGRMDSAVQTLFSLDDDSSAGTIGDADSLNGSLDVATVTLPQCDVQAVIERWNYVAGDSVFDVPSTASYYLLGVATGSLDVDEAERVCPSSVSADNFANTSAKSKDEGSVVVRLATPETMEFIDTVSVDHTWRNPHQLPFGIMENKIERMSMKQINNSINAAGYGGPLEFEQPPADMDLGFVVGLRMDKFGQNYCGGSLIAPSYVLTAAHCVTGERAQYVSVGSHDSFGAETEAIRVKSANVILHPQHGKRSRYSYDFAILELESQAYPKPIALDNTVVLNPSMYFTLFGYGANSATSTTLSAVLRSVELPFFPRDKCATMFPELDESMICVGGELARDACTGDSGSPLVRIVQGQPTLVGVVSSGRNGCGTPGVPGVYALVAAVPDFIDSVVAGSNWVDPSMSSSPLLALGGGNGASAPESPKKEVRSTSSSNSTTVMRSFSATGKDTADLPFEIINMANGSIAHQLSIVELAQDTPQRLEHAVMQFLVGEYSNVIGWAPQLLADWRIQFYSTGDLTGIMKAIAGHRANPLYARKDRFRRLQDSLAHDQAERMVSSKGACSDGH